MYKVGQRVKIIGNSEGMNIPVGKIVSVIEINHATSWSTGPGLGYRMSEYSHYWCHPRDVTSLVVSKEDLECEIIHIDQKISKLEADIERLEAEQFSIREKIRWLEETGASELDENCYKVYTALKILKNKDDLYEASLAISKLF